MEHSFAMVDTDDSEQPVAPSLDALVAGTVALMTAWASPCPDARIGLEAQRSLLARKVVSNLFFLQHHPCASPALRQVMANAHGRWVDIARAPGQPLEQVVPLTAQALH
jgi:hypothetical protein